MSLVEAFRQRVMSVEKGFARTPFRFIIEHMIHIYTSPTCPKCTLAKEFFDEHNVKYKVIDVSKDPDARAKMLEGTGNLSLPAIEKDGQWCSGFNKEALRTFL